MSRTAPRTAVVTTTHGRHLHLNRQQRSLSAGDVVPEEWVLVAMSDPDLLAWRTVWGIQPTIEALHAESSALPLAEARNRGARVAVEHGADVLVFLDVDCLAAPGLVGGYAGVVACHPDVIWSGPVTYLPAGLDERQLARPWLLDDPHPARPAPAPGELVRDADPLLFWSLSFAMSVPLWARVGGFDERYTGYGGEDTDFAMRAADRGVELGWVGDARAYHQHHPTTVPPVQHLDDILRNGRLFHDSWGTWPMEGWLAEFEQMGLIRRTHDGWERRVPVGHAL